MKNPYWENRIEIRPPLTIRDKLTNFGLALYRSGKQGKGNEDIALETIITPALIEFSDFLYQLKSSAKKYLLACKSTNGQGSGSNIQGLLDYLQKGYRCVDDASKNIAFILSEPTLQDFFDTSLQDAIKADIKTIQTNLTEIPALLQQNNIVLVQKSVTHFPHNKIGENTISRSWWGRIGSAFSQLWYYGFIINMCIKPFVYLAVMGMALVVTAIGSFIKWLSQLRSHLSGKSISIERNFSETVLKAAWDQCTFFKKSGETVRRVALGPCELGRF